ncbi:MAG: primosomal protein N', partial [Candidatus Obscuribacterales bacterium]|nr:primosomal protein N' [Candidatus Obscuribacterales bacterium]
SGKTEVYLRLIDRALRGGRSALLLVPEISLTPQLSARLEQRFEDQVSIWHSGISAGQRYDTWRGLRSGEIKVLLGARSACLANIADLALIILDEEHDGSYKQSNPSPRYNAKTVALERARREGAMVLFGSATPDVVTYYQAEKQDRILELPERVHKQAMPAVDIVDMRLELQAGNKSIFSLSLKNEIESRLNSKEQIILLINRRGYASHVFCRACGYVVDCGRCSVAMVYHRHSSYGSERKYLACHHCGAHKPMTISCPECTSPFIKEYGLGTQKVEESVKELFPQARVTRLDSDITSRKGAFKEVLDSFIRSDADILIGTQMVAKGLDIANVTLVGVLAADAALNMPDYRSSERGFQLLSQVAGRAGRGDLPGLVILQTYTPELPLLDWARRHDFKSFLEAELVGRKNLSYPPFSRIIRIVVSGANLEEVEKQCSILSKGLMSLLPAPVLATESHANNSQAVEVLGPAPCLIERIKGMFRYHLLVKADCQPELISDILGWLRLFTAEENIRIAIDVDAL